MSNSKRRNTRQVQSVTPIDDGLRGEPDTPCRAIRAIVLTLPLTPRAPTAAKRGPRNRNRSIRGSTWTRMYQCRRPTAEDCRAIV